MPKKSILLLGTRGIPASHGGFETFVERLAPYLVQQGWDVCVYCQEEGPEAIWEDNWHGVRRIHVPVSGSGTLSTIKFDWVCMRDALKRPGLLLSFGYPTALFALLPRLKRRRHVINMDGVEWKRSQFGKGGKAWLYLNERIAALLGNRLVADHPKIAEHLATRAPKRKITTIAYGADKVETADFSLLSFLDIESDKYAVVIARPERDNAFLEIITAFSSEKRGRKLVVLGNLKPDQVPYHAELKAAASDEVIFPGAIYEHPKVQALRKHARFYIHGHRVGGTNPSLVEALGAGNAILAMNNDFNSWVAGKGATYFETVDDCAQSVTNLFADDVLVATLRAGSEDQFKAFTWPAILAQYEELLLAEHP